MKHHGEHEHKGHKAPKMEHGDGHGHANMKGGLIHTPMGKAMEGKAGKMSKHGK